MRISNALVWLSWLIAALALIAAGSGLFWPGIAEPISFTTVRGETVTLFGRDPYRYDSLLIGAGFRGADAVVLFLAIPLLGYALARYRQGSLRGAFLLMGTLGFLLYNYASMAIGAAYNQLFLLYVALFSASLFAFILTWTAIDLQQLPARVAPGMPHRGLAIFMFVTALVFVVVWLGLGILLPLSQGQPPAELDAYTTVITHVLDLAILLPVSIMAGLLLLRREPLGYLLTFAMLVLAVFVVGISVPAATVSQLLAGYAFSVGQFVAFVGAFVVLGIIALWLSLVFLRNIADRPVEQGV